MKHSENSALLSDIRTQVITRWQPPPNLTVAQWAGEYRRLSAEASAQPGQWSNEMAPHLVEPMNACSPSDPCQEVILKFPSQSGKTEVILNFIAFIVDLDPGPILALQPNVKPMGEAFSKDRIAPMIRDTPALAGKISAMKSRDGENTIYHKKFAGGHLTISGAASVAGLASRPIKYLLADEIDRWEVTREGDALSLSEVRTKTFYNRKILKTSSPTIEDFGIDAEYQRADQQYELHFLCLECGKSQMPLFQHFELDRNDYAKSTYVCEHCGTIYPFSAESRLKKTAHWVQVKNTGELSKAYWCNQWGSTLATWRDTARQWFRAQGDPEKLRVVINTAFSECWTDPGDVIQEDALIARREHYLPTSLPTGVLAIYAGIDVQDDRLELEFVGYGRGEESWGIEYHVIQGDPDSPQVWRDLDGLLAKNWRTKDGRVLSLQAGCIDSGGHKTQSVYDYAFRRQSLRLWAIKGKEGDGRPIVSAPKKTRYGKKMRPIKLFTVGVDTAKTRIFSRLKIPDPGPEYCHFPMRYPEPYFAGLTAEKRVIKRRGGKMITEWIKIRPRNEPLDIRVYALAANIIHNPNYDLLAQGVGTGRKKPETGSGTRKPRERIIR